MKNNIISIEGGDGSGKSIMIEKIKAYFEEKDIDYIVTREPGGVKISERIRDIILDKENTEMDSKTEALLFAAARRQHLIEKVIPEMKKGKIIVFDRYVDSSIVYQGYVREIGMDEVYQLNLFATEGFLPGLTLVLDVDPKIGLKRISDNQREEDRLDLEGLFFHEKVREGYLLLAKKNQDRITLVDANRTIDEVFEDIKDRIETFLEE